MSVVSEEYRRTTDYVVVLVELVRTAQYRGLTTYQDIARLVGLPMEGNYMGNKISQILGTISEDEVRAGRPMLSALAVNVGGKPGPGFFTLARDLGQLETDGDEAAFWAKERRTVYKVWRRPLPKRDAQRT